MLQKVKQINHAELRYNALKRYSPGSAEAKRHEIIFNQLLSELSPEENAEYEAAKNFVETAAQKAARLKKEISNMESNRDSSSI